MRRLGATASITSHTSCLPIPRIRDNLPKIDPDNLPNNFRQIALHVRQIGFRQIVPYPVFAPGKRLKKIRYFSSPNMWSYTVYARSPSPSQRPAPTTIASRSPCMLGLFSCSTSEKKFGKLSFTFGILGFGKLTFGKMSLTPISQVIMVNMGQFAETHFAKFGKVSLPCPFCRIFFRQSGHRNSTKWALKFGKVGVGKMGFGKMGFGKMGFGKMRFGKKGIYHHGNTVWEFAISSVQSTRLEH